MGGIENTGGSSGRRMGCALLTGLEGNPSSKGGKGAICPLAGSGSGLRSGRADLYKGGMRFNDGGIAMFIGSTLGREAARKSLDAGLKDEFVQRTRQNVVNEPKKRMVERLVRRASPERLDLKQFADEFEKLVVCH